MNGAATLREAYQALAEAVWRLLGCARVTVAEWSTEDASAGLVVGGAGPAGGTVGRTIRRTSRVDQALRSATPYHGPLDLTRIEPDLADQLREVRTFTLVPLISGDSRLTVFVGWHEDISREDGEEATRLVQTLGRLTSIAERSRRERGDSRLGKILERVADGIVVATGDAYTLNEAAREILGVSDERPYDPAALNTRTLAGEPHPSTIAELRAALGAEPDGQRRFRVRATSLDGRELVLDGSSAAVADGIVIVFRDATAEHERQVLHEHYLSALFHYMPVPLTVGNARERRFISANRAFLDLIGYEADEVVDLQPPFPWWDDVESGRDGYTPGTVVHRLYRHKSGRAFPVEMAWHGIPGADGEVELLLGMATDLTEKRRLDMQLVQSGKLAAIGELAAGVAHEINNPLFAILGLTEFLLKEAEPESKARQRLELIQQTGLEIKEIVRALLDFARENAEERLVVPLEDVVRSTVDLVRRTNAHKGVELSDSYDTSGALVHVSPNQIKQIFLNLFANARQAMPQGGTVRVEVRQEGERVIASVSDDGPGIDPVALSRIFEPFYTTRRAAGGTGLGLSVSLGIAESHGGSLTASSEPNRGSTFTLSLPLAPEEVE